jgi:hypothetical protein
MGHEAFYYSFFLLSLPLLHDNRLSDIKTKSYLLRNITLQSFYVVDEASFRSVINFLVGEFVTFPPISCVNIRNETCGVEKGGFEGRMRGF